MKKLFNDVKRNPKYFTDRLSGNKRLSCADKSYFTGNGNAVKLVYEIIKLVNR